MFVQRAGAHGSWFVSDVHSLAYMAIPRAASTTLRGVVRDLGGEFRRLQQVIHMLFNNSAALRTSELSAEQRTYFTFTFVAEPVHHLLDGFAFVRSGGPEGVFNSSDAAWRAYRRELASVHHHHHSAAHLRQHLFWNPHLLPQAYYLAQKTAPAKDGLPAQRVRFDFIGGVGEDAFARDWAHLVAVLSSRGVPADMVKLGSHGERRSSPARAASLREAERCVVDERSAGALEQRVGPQPQREENAVNEGRGPVSETLPARPACRGAPAAFLVDGGSASDGTANAMGIDPLRGFCRVRWTEFSCLGFALPLPCRMLTADAAWVF